MAKSLQLLDNLIRKLENNLGISQEGVPESEIAVEAAPKEESKGEEETKAVATEESKVEEEKDMAPYDLFKLLDIRSGDMVECWLHPNSDYLYCERINIGEENVREIGSGLQKDVPISDMKGPVFVMANLKPRSLGGFKSHGMVLAVHVGESFALLIPPEGMPVGERPGVEGEFSYSSDPVLPPVNPKKKILEKCIPFFHTDNEGFACFGRKRLVTSKGYIKTQFNNANIS